MIDHALFAFAAVLAEHTDIVANNLVASMVGALVGASGAAFGLALAHGNRLTRVESKVGITADGSLTGNGLIGSVAEIRAQLQED